MIRKILTRNKMKYLEYNSIRRHMFIESSPKDSEVILYLLPWLLSVNHPDCPGYIPGLTIPFRVFNVGNEKGVKTRESYFKEQFGIQVKGTLMKLPPVFSMIHGLYTIGSVGTISQTIDSDCDIWVCYDSLEMNFDQVRNLNQKLYLIKEWLNHNCRIPVYFFVSDIQEIRECRFGIADEESSGSSQAHVLMEEFYRTCVLICGKIPLWWVCYDSHVLLSYERVLSEIGKAQFIGDDFVDMGNLENVQEQEYFGAALWQLHKSLDRPLKSILKMLMLKMQLDAPKESLLCHKFRQHIMVKAKDKMIADPSVFSMFFVMSYYQGKHDAETIGFIKECFYLRCGIRQFSKNLRLKKYYRNIFFSKFEISKDLKAYLDQFSKWDLSAQIQFGDRLFKLLLVIYREISRSHAGISSQMDREDLTVIGRKIQTFYEERPHKVAILPRPTEQLNITGLVLQLDKEKWQVFPGNTSKGILVADPDILYVVAFSVKNELFETGRTQMVPNRSGVSLPEIENLALKIREFIFRDQSVTRMDYLKKAVITRILAVISFEEEPWEKSTSNVGMIYSNSWGEVFVRRFSREKLIKDFLGKMGITPGQIPVDYYLQKKCMNYHGILRQIKSVFEG